MCRIAGIINKNLSREVFREKLLAMEEALAHGGPDDRGVYLSEKEGLAFLHRRLSILDLSPAGHQPMKSKGENFVLSYNGEIYNFASLATHLEAAGYEFQSQTDTEVVLKGYQEWGEKAFSRFEGMYAFALFDRLRQKVFLVRDHAGIKPLYYYQGQRGLIFASEVRAFTAFDHHWPEDPHWKSLFLLFGHLPEPQTTLEGVTALPRGSYLLWDLKSSSARLKSHWKYGDYYPPQSSSSLFHIKSTLVQSVKKHLISDAPLGVFLSGGMDSSLLAILASQQVSSPITTLSIVFEEKEYSEEKFQLLVARQIGSNHFAHSITSEIFWRELPSIFQAMDQPTMDGINSYFISQAARKRGLKAVLSGLGGDELFGGYPSFSRIEKLWSLRHIPREFFQLASLFDRCQSDRLQKLSFLALPFPLNFYLLCRGLFSLRETARLLDQSEIEIKKNLLSLWGNWEKPEWKGKNLASYLESAYYMQNQLLKDTDFMSMWHGVEVRVPFLDRELLQLVFSLPERWKFKKGRGKYLLEEGFGHLLPNPIVSRPKQGFVFPFSQWIKREGRELVEENLKRANIGGDTFEKLWERFCRGSLNWSRLWSLVLLGRWS